MTDFDFDQFLRLPRLAGLLLSPDGTRLVVSVSRPAPDGKKMRSSIWRLDPRGEQPPVRLTRSAPGDSAGAFTPDGSLIFTSARQDPDRSPDPKDDEEETTSLWLLPADGGEARLLCSPSGGVEAVRVARNADTIVFAASVFAGASDLLADRERQKARKKAGVDALLLEGYPIRHWDHWLAPRELHLFAARLADDGESVSEPVDLTPDAGGALVETTFDITPDGQTVLTEWRDWSDLTNPRERLLAIDTSDGSRRFLTELGDHWYGTPACSPDGRYVAAVRADVDRPESVGDKKLVVLDLESGAARDLTPDLDLWPTHPVWAPDSRSVFFTADRQGDLVLMSVELDGGEARVLDDQCAWTEVTPSPDGTAVYGLNSGYDAPPHPVVRVLAEPDKRRLPSFRELDRLELPGRVERVTATAGDSQEVASWFVLPKDASEQKPAPLIVWVHGGPLGSWNAWHWRWNPHLLAARGYAILLPDPALSTGYGLDFINRGWGRWGDQPYSDVMAAYEAAVTRPDIDATRTGLMGGSFGGYMANWVAGSTDRFRAIVTHASLWELRGFHGTTDAGTWWEREFGNPYVDDAVYQQQSPHRLVGNIRTPMLVVHGALDYRVPISEGLRLWTDLSRHGVEAKFLYFPDENHWVLKPQNARLWYETVIAFLDQYVRGEEWRRPALL